MERLTIELGSIVGYTANNKTLEPAELSVGQTREILKRLCDYENTGLQPSEILSLKKSADTKTKNQRIKIVGIAKPSVLKKKVKRYGLLINGKRYYSSDLALNHFGEYVDVVKRNQKAHVFYQGKLIEIINL